MKKILLLISCSLFACKKEVNQLKLTGYTKYTVAQGSHNSTPVFLRTFWGGCNINGSAYFTENSKYDLGDSDQYDWNKLDGFKLDFNSVPNNAAMIGWRYNLVDSTFEIAPYFNNYGIVLPDSNQIIKVAVNEVFDYNIRLSGNTATISITKDNITTTKFRVLKYASFFTRVSLWFGGNRVSPKNVEVFIKR